MKKLISFILISIFTVFVFSACSKRGVVQLPGEVQIVTEEGLYSVPQTDTGECPVNSILIEGTKLCACNVNEGYIPDPAAPGQCMIDKEKAALQAALEVRAALDDDFGQEYCAIMEKYELMKLAIPLLTEFLAGSPNAELQSVVDDFNAYNISNRLAKFIHVPLNVVYHSQFPNVTAGCFPNVSTYIAWNAAVDGVNNFVMPTACAAQLGATGGSLDGTTGILIGGGGSDTIITQPIDTVPDCVKYNYSCDDFGGTVPGGSGGVLTGGGSGLTVTDTVVVNPGGGLIVDGPGLGGDVIPTTLATPNIVCPTSWTIAGAGSVSITAASGATIKYTKDGSDPTTSSTVAIYNVAFSITNSATIKAYAYRSGYTNSAVAPKVCTNPNAVIGGGDIVIGGGGVVVDTIVVPSCMAQANTCQICYNNIFFNNRIKITRPFQSFDPPVALSANKALQCPGVDVDLAAAKEHFIKAYAVYLQKALNISFDVSVIEAKIRVAIDDLHDAATYHANQLYMMFNGTGSVTNNSAVK